MHLVIFALLPLILVTNCEETSVYPEYTEETSTESGLLSMDSVNPDSYLNPGQIIRRYGYTSESHVIETEDGYLLTVHRIPKSKNGTVGKQPVLLQHGLLATSTCFLDEGNKSLAFILSDLGYDVWLGNARGNEYSRAHVNLLPEDTKFWNFSWHEMAIFDIPAVVTYISDTTNSPGDILYVGHSMGTTMFFAFASLKPQIAAKVKAMVALAPVAFMTHLTSPIKYLAPWVNDIDFIAKHLGINEFLPSSKVMKLMAFDCLSKFTRKICENLLFLIAGFNKDQVDEKTLEVVLAHMPSGTSTKTVLHYLQEISSKGDFRQYDYGTDGNMIQYGQPTPPEYNLQDIQVPVYLMYADSDMLANPLDVKRLYTRLTQRIGIYEVPLPSFNHVDFLFAKDVVKLVYNNLTATLKQYAVNSSSGQGFFRDLPNN